MFTIVLLFFVPVLLAEEDTEDEPPEAADGAGNEESPGPVPILIDVDVSFPSALDRVDQAAEELGQEPSANLGDLVGTVPDMDPLADDGGLVRGRFGVRPRLAWTGRLGAPGAGMRGGLVLRHQWWSLLPIGPQWVGESALSASLAFAGVRGPELSLQSLAGAWVGPVALTVGPRASWDRIAFSDGTDLDGGLTLGPVASVGVELGPVALQLGAGPSWLLVGERGPASLPVGDEWLGLAAVGLELGVLRWTLRGQARETDAGTLLDVSLGLNLALGE